MAILLLSLWACIGVLIRKGHDLTLYPVVLMTVVCLIAIFLGVKTHFDNQNIEE
jgi:type VI protein secretion system component VasF